MPPAVATLTTPRWPHLLEALADVILELDIDGTVVSRHETRFGDSGIANSEVEGTLLLPRIHPEDVPGLLARWREVAGDPSRRDAFTVRVRHATEADRWLSAQITCVGVKERPDGVVSIVAASIAADGPLSLHAEESDGFSLAESAPVGLAIYTERSGIAWSNPRFGELVGRGAGPTTSTERSEHPVIGVLEELTMAHAQSEELQLEPRPTMVNYKGRTLRVAAHRSLDGNDLLVCVQDISSEVAAFSARTRAEATFSAAFEHSQAGIAVVTLGGVFTEVNPAFSDITGHTASDLAGQTFGLITHPDDLATDEEYVAELLAGERESYRMEKRYLHRSGGVVWVDLRVALVRGAGGAPLHFVANIVDITERIETEAQLRDENDELGHQATHDHLTGLPNRLLMDRYLERLEQRGDDGVFALVCDLDGFKRVNDEYGHQVGDVVLEEVARRLRGCSREGDLVARVGGDEFVVLANLGADPDLASKLGERLVAAVCRPILTNDVAITVGLSVGINLLRGGVDIAQSMRAADEAAYEVKRDGGGSLLVPM